MKKNRLFVMLVLVVILLGSLLVVNSSAGQAGADNQSAWDDYTSPFGLEIRDLSQFSLIEETNNHWLRVNGLRWSDVQPGDENDWKWENVVGLENNLRTARAMDQEVILIVRSTPEWAQKHEGIFCGPIKQENFADFANFMDAVVTRYSHPDFNITHFEIWNEPDDSWEKVNPTYPHGCWGDPNLPDYGGRYYGEMLKQIYPAIKNANPEAQVVVGGLLMPCDPVQHWYSDHCPMSYFLRGILHVGAGSAFDILNFHAYSHYNPNRSNMIQMERNAINWWSNRGGEVEGKLRFVNEIMAQYGVSKPIFLSETGLLDYDNKHVDSSDPNSVESFEQAKADYVVWLHARNLAWGIDSTNIYNDYRWNRTGLFGRDGEQLPAYDAYDTLTTALDNALYMRKLDLGTGILGFEFTTGNRIWVLFSENGTLKNINVPERFDRAYDLFGNPVLDINGELSFTRPIYVELLNTPPVAKNNHYVFNLDTGFLNVAAPGVLINDSDADWDPLTAVLLDPPSFGELTLNPDGSFTYVLDDIGAFEGKDTFIYCVNDGEVCSEPATVTITDQISVYLPLIKR